MTRQRTLSRVRRAAADGDPSAAAASRGRPRTVRQSERAAAAPRRYRAVLPGRHRRRRPGQSAVLAAVSALDRRRRRNAGGSTCPKAPRSTRATSAAGSFRSARGSGRSSALPAAVSRRGSCGRHRAPDGSPASYVWNEEGTDAVLSEDGVARRDGDRTRAPAQHPVARRLRDLSRRGAGSPRFQPAATLERSRSERHPRRAADRRHAHAADADRRRPADRHRSRSRPDSSPRIDAGDPQTRAVLGYLSGNCGACHNGDGQISAHVPSFAYADLLGDADAVAQGMLGQRTRWQAPGRAEGTMLIDPSSPEQSAILLRMRSRRPSSQMPPLGTVLQDQEAIEKMRKWIGCGDRPDRVRLGSGLERLFHARPLPFPCAQSSHRRPIDSRSRGAIAAPLRAVPVTRRALARQSGCERRR